MFFNTIIRGSRLTDSKLLDFWMDSSSWNLTWKLCRCVERRDAPLTDHRHTLPRALRLSPGWIWTHPKGLGSWQWMAAAQCSCQPRVAHTALPSALQAPPACRSCQRHPWNSIRTTLHWALGKWPCGSPHKPALPNSTNLPTRADSLPAGPLSSFHYLLSFSCEIIFYLKKAMKSKCSHHWTNKPSLWMHQTLRGLLQLFLIYTEWTDLRFAISSKIISLAA